MALLDIFKGRAQPEPAVAAKAYTADVGVNSEGENLRAFDNSNITFNTPLGDVDIDSVLRDKQRYIFDLYKLSDYYTDSDPIVHGIIKNVYVPFTSTKYFLTCPNTKTIAIFEDYYKQIRLNELMDDIFLQKYKYNNVFVYIWNGVPMTLPPHKCTIANVMLNGEPVVDFKVDSIQIEFKQRLYSLYNTTNVSDEKFEEVLEGYPPEIADAIRNRKQYARLAPENVFVLQGLKEGWMRYAVPWIASALMALAKKELISKYETSLLNLGSRSFLHVTYGDDKMDMLPDANQLRSVKQIFSSAMKNSPLAVTNYLAKATPVQADLSDLYQWPLYANVNADILSAGGISGIIVNGASEEGSTFASAQVSVQSVMNRINATRAEFEVFMAKLNKRLIEDIRLVKTNNLKNVPEFHFVPTDMNGEKEIKETCEKLWTEGLVSTYTMLKTFGYSLTEERKNRETEASDGTDEVMSPRQIQPQAESAGPGRPKLDDDERNSDPDNAIRSKQSKDSADGDIE